MDENSAHRGLPRFTLPDLLSLQRGSKVESSTASRDQRASTPRPSRELERRERRNETVRDEEAGRLRIEVGDLRGLVERQGAEILRLRREQDEQVARCKRRDEKIGNLKQEIAKMRGSHKEAMKGQIRQIGAVQEQLKQTEVLLEARSAELSGAHAFLSTTDRLSEMEVLSIVRDLNENIYQVAVGLAEEWEKLDPPQVTSRMDVDHTSLSCASVLAQLTRNRDLIGLTFLLQTWLCCLAVDMTSSWDRHQESGVLGSVYKPPPDSAPLMEELARVLDETGSFSSIQSSLEFVRTAALERIESIVQIAQRLEAAFMVDVTSSDATLLFEAPDTIFDEARMTNEFGSDSVSVPGGRDRVAGTTEVGVGKTIRGGPDGNRRVEILLKTKVVLVKDVVGDGK